MSIARFHPDPGPAPTAPKRPTTKTVHDIHFTDEYAWLRAENWREVLKNPSALPADIRAALVAENAYCAKTLAPTQELQDQLFKELRARVKEDDADVPSSDGGYEYYDRYRQGGQHRLVCRRKLAAGAPEELLLDGDELGKDKPFFSLAAATVSPDHALMGWSCDEKGSEYYTIRVRDLASGVDRPDAVNDTDGSLVWSSDGKSFYYVRRDENHRPKHVFRHKLGAPAASDELIFEEKDPGWSIDIHRSRSRRFCVIEIADHDSTEAWLIDLTAGDGKPVLVEPRQRKQRYDVEPHGERLFIRTNVDGAEDFKIVEAPLATPGRAHWRDVVPHKQGRMIAGLTSFRDWLVRLEREDGLPRIIVRDIASGAEHAIAFDEEAYALNLNGVREYATDVMRFSYSSMTTPRETFDYDMRKRDRTLLKRQEIPSGHDPAQYVTRRLLAPAPDGALVPVSLFHKKGLELDGSAPLFITGYGAYGHASQAQFSSTRLSLVDRGFVYAIAHIRGGTDKGWAWYENGKLGKKRNTFTDFIAATRHLIAQGYGAQGRVIASGGSAGGMLMGAIANMAPELYAGIIADVPFVDVMNTMMDADLPLTPPEWLEWGNPIEDATAFNYMLSYSPYDNVKAQTYPAILAMGGLTDPRVTYWEPAKWIARLRAVATSRGPILFKTNMDAGHGGASGRFDALKDLALEYAFALAAIEHARAGV